MPNRLIIPAIGVDAVVLPMEGIAGSPVPPDNPTEASWMSNGVVPGNPGAAPIQGHTWSGGDGVFDNLGNIQDRDSIVLIGKNCQLSFVVKHVWRHKPPNLSGAAFAKLYPVSGKPSLTIVTCGDFEGDAYYSRIVVRAQFEAVKK
jgi:sortase (surface protein transpeptidase)